MSKTGTSFRLRCVIAPCAWLANIAPITARVGSDDVDRRQDWLHSRDAAPLV
jgi:hypothetical protein